MQKLTRRAIVAGLLSGVANAALADAPLVSVRPLAREGNRAKGVPASQTGASATRPQSRSSFEDMIAQANLGGTVGCVLANARSGAVLVDIDGAAALPPASVTKALTALYALDALGGAHRFVTRIVALGPVNNGILDGDLMIVGGGDPTLDTDDLAKLAKALVADGLKGVTGRLLCWRGALPYAEEIEPSQLDHLGYNPAVSGLNLNYNRVHFEWRRDGGAWQTTMDARSDSYRPLVNMAQVRIVDRAAPVWVADGPDNWSMARSALGNGGSRWMPVRQPALYAGDVFRTLCRAEGLALPEPEVRDTLPAGGVDLAVHQSDTLRVILRETLLYSTNLTAEVCGLAATQARLGRAPDIAGSAAEMTRWLGAAHGIAADFKDHSGLSDENRISADQMVKLLVAVGSDGPLRPLLRRIAMLDADGNRMEAYPIEVEAKTGTLNFVSSLAGYVKTVGGTELAFAIFAANGERRAQGKAAGGEVPAGSPEWNRRAKALQQRLLQRWGLVSG